MEKRIVIVVGSFGRCAIDLANAVEAAEKLSIAASMSIDNAKDVVENAKQMSLSLDLPEQPELRLIEARKNIEAIKLRDAHYPMTPKPHKDRYYQRHCRRNNWRK